MVLKIPKLEISHPTISSRKLFSKTNKWIQNQIHFIKDLSWENGQKWVKSTKKNPETCVWCIYWNYIVAEISPIERESCQVTEILSKISIPSYKGTIYIVHCALRHCQVFRKSISWHKTDFQYHRGVIYSISILLTKNDFFFLMKGILHWLMVLLVANLFSFLALFLWKILLFFKCSIWKLMLCDQNLRMLDILTMVSSDCRA